MLAVIGLGTNQGDREENLQNALSALQLLPNTSVQRFSPIYETKPYGFLQQPDFLNMAAEVETALSPTALLGACLGIEAGLGRVRFFKNGPRRIDLDFLLGENVSSATEELTVPHPQILNRSFVLVPLMDLYPTGTVFGFDFKPAYLAHPKDDIAPYCAKRAFFKK